MLRSADPVLAVHDLAGAARWYEGVLAATTHEPAPGWLFCRCGDVTIMLGHCPDALPAADLGDHSYVAYLRVGSAEDVDAVHARAVAAGAEVLKAPTDEPWGQRELALRHPEGHRFMVGAPTAGA